MYVVRLRVHGKERTMLRAKGERDIARGGRGAKEARREVTASQLLGTVTCVRLGACSVRVSEPRRVWWTEVLVLRSAY